MVKDSAKLLSGWTVGPGRPDGPTTTRTGTPPARSPCSASATPTAPPTAGPRGRLPPLPRHPPRHRPHASRAGWRSASSPTTPRPALVSHRVARSSWTPAPTSGRRLRALVAHPEFRASAGGKVRTPVDDLVATVRVPRRERPRRRWTAKSFANGSPGAANDVLRFQLAAPGRSAGDQPRSGPPRARMLRSYRMHWSVAGGWYPDGRRSIVPATHRSCRARDGFDVYFDHLVARVLGRPSSNALLQAVCQGWRPWRPRDGGHPDPPRLS